MAVQMGLRSFTRAGGSPQTRLILRLVPVGMAAMVAIDQVLGDRAEYFHAGRLLQAWGRVFRGRGFGDVHFIAGQEEMGDVGALVAGSAAFVAEPALVVAGLVVCGSRIARFVVARAGR